MRLLFLLSFFMVFKLSSQFKYEREYRVSEEKVPKSAITFLEQFQLSKKIKWYGEESQDGKTFEAKFYYKSQKYSFEFDEKGKIIDVEVKRKLKSIEKEDRLNIEAKLKTLFRKYRLKKLQIQFSGTPQNIVEELTKYLETDNYDSALFELVVSGVKKKHRDLYELLLNSKGEVLKELKFKELNSDNLEF
ncbi:hypothetical protein [uncultured Tenacibaculum sp.]|uniref:hypothetical protein n=1 Tax=uncultured Tenacibaculum sp. TaxID=174713 RepID=UPI0026133CCA|nr:hypothetical protein [uncultured Tenacibaculum sp.]